MSRFLPAQMTALKLEHYGPLREALAFVETALPRPGPGEVLVKIEAAGLNPHDVKQVLGDLKRHEPLTLPATIGGDFAGEVVGLGAGVTDVRLGDRVFGIAKGALAQFARAKTTAIAPLPGNLSYESSAGLPVAGLTSLQAFARAGGVRPGDKVLVHAGSGGVGSFAIQYAKAKGAEIWTTAGATAEPMLRTLGADHFIDYKTQDYRRICAKFDVVFDTLGGDFTYDAFKIVRPGGHVVSIVPAEINAKVAKEFRLPWPIRAFLGLKPSRIRQLSRQTQANYDFVFMRPTQSDMRALGALLKRDQVRPVTDRVFAFAQAVEALEYLEEGHARGKVIVSFATA